MSTDTAWYEWLYGREGLPAESGDAFEVHIVPALETRRHKPQEWCDPQIDLREDGVFRFRHRVRGDDFLTRAGLS